MPKKQTFLENQLSLAFSDLLSEKKASRGVSLLQNIVRKKPSQKSGGLWEWFLMTTKAYAEKACSHLDKPTRDKSTRDKSTTGGPKSCDTCTRAHFLLSICYSYGYGVSGSKAYSQYHFIKGRYLVGGETISVIESEKELFFPKLNRELKDVEKLTIISYRIRDKDTVFSFEYLLKDGDTMTALLTEMYCYYQKYRSKHEHFQNEVQMMFQIFEKAVNARIKEIQEEKNREKPADIERKEEENDEYKKIKKIVEINRVKAKIGAERRVKKSRSLSNFCYHGAVSLKEYSFATASFVWSSVASCLSRKKVIKKPADKDLSLAVIAKKRQEDSKQSEMKEVTTPASCDTRKKPKNKVKKQIVSEEEKTEPGESKQLDQELKQSPVADTEKLEENPEELINDLELAEQAAMDATKELGENSQESSDFDAELQLAEAEEVGDDSSQVLSTLEADPLQLVEDEKEPVEKFQTELAVEDKPHKEEVKTDSTLSSDLSGQSRSNDNFRQETKLQAQTPPSSAQGSTTQLMQKKLISSSSGSENKQSTLSQLKIFAEDKNKVTADTFDKSVISILFRLRKLGIEPIIFGGAARSVYLSMPIKDLDIMVRTDIRKLKNYLEGAEFIPSKFPILAIKEKKIEIGNGANHDFTINTLQIRLKAHCREKKPEFQLCMSDLARKDLKDKIVRTVIAPEDSFTEDPLRILRAFYFSSRLNFKLDDDLVKAVPRFIEKIIKEPARLFHEFIKLLSLEKNSREKYVALLVQHKCMQPILTSLNEYYAKKYKTFNGKHIGTLFEEFIKIDISELQHQQFIRQAVLAGDHMSVKMLLALDHDVSRVDRLARTPLDWACEMEKTKTGLTDAYHECIKALKEAGCLNKEIPASYASIARMKL